MGFSGQRLYPCVEDIDFFCCCSICKCRFHHNSLELPKISHYFALRPSGKTPQTLAYPLEFQRTLLHPWNFPLISSTRGIRFSSWKTQFKTLFSFWKLKKTHKQYKRIQIRIPENLTKWGVARYPEKCMGESSFYDAV